MILTTVSGKRAVAMDSVWMKLAPIIVTAVLATMGQTVKSISMTVHWIPVVQMVCVLMELTLSPATVPLATMELCVKVT